MGRLDVGNVVANAAEPYGGGFPSLATLHPDARVRQLAQDLSAVLEK